MHGRSHTRSPGMSIMRVDNRELPLSAIPLCQLFPCHLGPPRPTLSINLYMKGCLDCTIGAFHISIPADFSPSEFYCLILLVHLSLCNSTFHRIHILYKLPLMPTLLSVYTPCHMIIIGFWNCMEIYFVGTNCFWQNRQNWVPTKYISIQI